MLITKFNKMIRNRILWWFIGGIVIITFVGFFSPQGGCEKMPGSGGVGTLFGEPVSDAELRQARFNTYLSLCMMVGRIIPITESVNAELDEQAWKRLAALRTAKTLGLTVSKDEVLNLIKNDPQFTENGAFSRDRYTAFTRGVLGSLNATVTQFEQQLAENILLQKVQNLTAAAAWVSPADMNRIVSRYADSFAIQYVTVSSNRVSGDVAVDDAALRRYFETHTNDFIIPEQVAVKYVQFPISNYLARAAVENAAVEEYYDTHSEEFASADTNAPQALKPLESVRGLISNKLVRAAATDLARNAALDLVVALAPARDGSAASFDALAAATGLTVRTTGLFDARTGLPGPALGDDFVEAAFRLRPTPDEYFSDVITGPNHVYVLALITNTEARLPDFAEVKTKVAPPAREQAKQDKLMKIAGETRDRIEAGLKTGKSFKAAAGSEALNVVTTELFSVYSAPEALSTPEILEDITSRDSGELTGVLPGTNALIIAYVAERKPASVDDSSTVRAQLGMNITRRRARALFTEWEDDLIRHGKKENTAPAESRGGDELPIVD
jgi:peptidyl-prolyl cis-trans isomerase D